MKDISKFVSLDRIGARWSELAKRSPWVAVLRGLVGRSGIGGSAPIVQPASVAGRALTVVIAIMCFLACLTAGAVYIVNEAADNWFSDIASEITVQVSPEDEPEVEKKVTLVALFLAKQPGIVRVSPFSVEDSAALLEPWLGSSNELTSLPIPRLIAVEISRSDPPDLAGVRQALENNFKGVTLDDHRRWQSELRTVTRSLFLGGVSVLFFVAAATVASIVSATKSAMASNREIIEVLHFVGAQEKFIAHEFEKHFLNIGIRAGLVGALGATILFLMLPIVMRVLGGGGLAAEEFRQLIGSAALDWPGYLLFGVVVVVVASLCMLTSRYGVYRILKSYE
ncbi:MAG: ABC transporter permease [Hyphomicrobiaceae bacterium]|nr:ABC transporter permease [Hyphomicrobiaceae bacterium]